MYNKRDTHRVGEMKQWSNVNHCKVIQVIHVCSTTGNGTKESPFRNIDEYFSLKGKLLAKRDHTEQIIVDAVEPPKPSEEK